MVSGAPSGDLTRHWCLKRDETQVTGRVSDDADCMILSVLCFRVRTKQLLSSCRVKAHRRLVVSVSFQKGSQAGHCGLAPLEMEVEGWPERPSNRWIALHVRFDDFQRVYFQASSSRE